MVRNNTCAVKTSPVSTSTPPPYIFGHGTPSFIWLIHVWMIYIVHTPFVTMILIIATNQVLPLCLPTPHRRVLRWTSPSNPGKKLSVISVQGWICKVKSCKVQFLLISFYNNNRMFDCLPRLVYRKHTDQWPWSMNNLLLCGNVIWLWTCLPQLWFLCSLYIQFESPSHGTDFHHRDNLDNLHHNQ